MRCGVKYPIIKVCGGSIILCMPIFYSTSSKQGNYQMDFFFNKLKSTNIVEEKSMLFGT
jgi:hypothetical protein